MVADWCCTVECLRSTQVIEQQDTVEFDTVGTVVEAVDSTIDFVMDSFVGRMCCWLCWCQLEGSSELLVVELAQLVKVLVEDDSSH